MTTNPFPIFEFDAFRLDVAEKTLLHSGQVVDLTPKALAVLTVLVANHGRTINKDELLEEVWQDVYVDEKTVRQNISTIRKVLEETGNGRGYIRTFPKVGYRFMGEVRVLIPADSPKIIESQETALAPANASVSDAALVENGAAPTNGSLPLQVLSQHQGAASATASVEQTATPVAIPASQSLTRLTAYVKQRRTALLSAAILLAVLVGGFVIFQNLRKSVAPAFTNRAALRIVSIEKWKCEPGDALSEARFSPDGNLIATTMVKNDQRDLYIKQVKTGEPRQITNDAAQEQSPVWSPDGAEIAYLSSDGKQIKVYAISYLGGAPQYICDLPNDCPLRLVRWSKDNAKIYYESQGNLFALHLDSKQREQLTDFDFITYAAKDFAVSADEKQIAYQAKANNQYDIFVKSFGSEKPVQLTNDAAYDQTPCWLPDNRTLVYSSSSKGSYQTFIISTENPVPTPIAPVESDAFITDVSADAGKLLYSSATADSDIWRVNAETGEEKQITNDADLDLWQEISPDGTQLVYQQLDAVEHLYDSSLILKNLESSSASQMIKLGQGYNARWSPDGSKIAFLRNKENQISLHVVNKTGDGEKQIAMGLRSSSVAFLPYNQSGGDAYAWSPDGHKIAYCSNKSGSWNIYIWSDDGKAEVNLSNNQQALANWMCVEVKWSPDGKKVAFQTVHRADNKALRSIQIYDGQKTESVFESELFFALLGWTADGKDLLATTFEQAELPKTQVADTNLLKVIKKEAIVKLKNVYFKNLKLSSDRKQIAFVIHEAGIESLNVMNVDHPASRTILQSREKNLFLANLNWATDGKTIYYTRQKRNNLIAMIQNSEKEK